jgi:hypothetical protein
VRRLYLLAIVAGSIAEVGLVLVIFNGASRSLGLLLFVEAVLLGLVFGAGPGIAGAVAPLVGLSIFELARGTDTNPVGLLGAVLFVAILQAFFAGMTGAMRDRYWRRTGV